MKKLFSLVIFITATLFVVAQSSTCIDSDPFCTGTSYEFPASTNAGSAETGPDYGCLSSQPNPVWYHMRIQYAGDIIIDMFSEPSEDIDFICWGPFDDPQEPCVDDLTGEKIVDCSYSGNSTETCNISGAAEGEYYIMMITNYSNDPCNINFSQSGGDGATDCGILPGNINTNSPVCEGDTLKINANTVSGAEYSWTGPNDFSSTEQFLEFPNATSDNAGEYTLIIQVDDEVSQPVYLEAVVNENPNSSAGEDKSIPFGTSVQLDGSIVGDQEAYNYMWTPSDKLLNDAILTPTTVNLDESVEFTMRATDTLSGCYTDDIAVVTVTGSALSVNVNAETDAICLGDLIQIKAQTSGGSGVYSYSWTSDPEGFTSDIYNPTVQPEVTTTYFVTISDGFNDINGQLTMTVNELPETSLQDDFAIPFGTSTSLTSTTTGGDGNYSYSWTDETFLVDGSVANPYTTNLYNPATFTLQVTDGNGCQSTTENVLISLSGGPLTAVPSISDNAICLEDETTLYAAASGGSESYSYQWKEDGEELISTEESVVISPEQTTSYELTVDDGFNTNTKTVTVTVNPLPEINLVSEEYTVENDTVFTCVYDTLLLDASSGVISSYLWDNGSVESEKFAGTSGIAFDIQTHSVEVTHSQTGCVNNAKVTIIFSFASCASVEELELMGVSLYPVPAKENVVIQLDETWNEAVNFSIMNMLGQTIFAGKIDADQQSTTDHRIDVSDFETGVYLLKIKGKEKSASAKIIVE